ncbi:MAG: bifunctional glutamate N-acetyltransferase/amino-acid acetyltransferase ArgJ [Melioribacteraceae bacterium]|nr:bifunctional glutamate N-acetyltransferase/amino-acid acetyltransferase ArgJ [Melioribacteraceae bacterium]
MWQYISDGSITSVKGIRAAGINCGLKKRKKDIALITSSIPANAAGTFTLNKVQAAPVVVSKEIIAEGKKVMAILINSGNANACTGVDGFKDAVETQNYCAEKLNIDPKEVIISSTGVIGQRMNTEVIKTGIDQLTEKLNDDGGIDAAEAIMTTDLKIKSFALNLSLEMGEITLGGICKGSGMIHPNMATMLAFLATDADIDQKLLQKALSKAVAETFNKISVDGETSTNDMVILISNGASGIKITEDTHEYNLFLSSLKDICRKMAKAIVADGEGATKLITISIKNAKTEEDADTIARAIAKSPLVKTAINGCDANWGRIISAAGSSGAEINPTNTSIFFDNLPVLLPDYQVVVDEEKAKQILSKDEIKIELDLSDGVASSTWWTCDFSEDYVKINASYRS